MTVAHMMAETGSLPPFMMTQPETGQGGLRDASVGLTTQVLDGKTWALNPLMNDEWQLVYLLEAPGLPAGLSGLAGEFYGDPMRWREIYDVPQNKAIQGPDPNVGLHVGDKILIPGLVPSQSPGATDETPGQPPGMEVQPSNGNGAPTIIFQNGPGAEPTPVVHKTTTTKTTTTTEKKESWWTPGRSAAVAGAVVGTTALVVWMAAPKKKKKRKKRKKRRR